MDRTARGTARVRTAQHGTSMSQQSTRHGTAHTWAVPDLDFRHACFKSTARLEMDQSTTHEKARNKHVSFFNESKLKIL